MGCLQSKPSAKASKTALVVAKQPGPFAKKCLSQDEIRMRIVAPDQSQVFTQSGITVRYAWVTQRGYYPDSPDKDNQDSYSCAPQLSEYLPDVSLFGVYDGHGGEGHTCSQFVATQLPQNLVQKLQEALNDTARATEKAILQAHKITNESLHANPNIDTSFSGTTSISVLFRDKTMYVSNVGDSRAIVVSNDGSGTKVNAMSSDHTPYRKDERFRVMKYGARILTVDQVLQNNEQINDNWGDITLGDDLDEAGDPPRVWAQDEDFPGTAFTRSLGDKVAEDLGVTAEPEILIRRILNYDKYVIIASDGVFEFLTNQMVADIVTEKEDPLDACHAVVAAAYDLWLRLDVRSDDITVVILQFTDIIPDSSSPEDASTKNLIQSQFFSSAAIFNSAHPVNPSARVLLDSRPVRRVISREKRKKIIFSAAYEKEPIDPDAIEIDIRPEPTPKNEKDAMEIGKAIKLNFLFQHLSVDQRVEVINFMQPLDVKSGEWVIKQGEEGDNFYVINQGRFEVRVKAVDDDEESGGNVVHVYESGHDLHPGFGELALLYGRPRAASVIALTDGKLWSLDKETFKHFVIRSIDNHKCMKQILRNVQLFACLSLEQIRRIVGLLRVVKFSAGEVLVEEGDKNDNFYVIVKGECESSSQEDDEIIILKKDNYFNEYSMLSDEEKVQRKVVALTDVKALYVSRTDFESNVGFLAPKVESHKMVRANSLMRDDRPTSFSEIKIEGLVSSDSMGSIFLGCFGTLPESPRVTVRSYTLSDVHRLKVRSAVLNAVEAFRVVTSSSTKNCFVYRLLGVFADKNALHLIFNIPVVADLDSILRIRNEENSVQTTKDVIIYVATCVFSALDFLHNLGIIYRSVQPESIYVDLDGRLVLGGFRVSKVGKVGGRTYTITGATEYLAPEQVGRQGHTASVDHWSLGVVLYELATGVHPFTAATEVEVYQKISSFGTRVFPKLFYPPEIAPELIYVIDKLLVPVPDLRLGAGPRGFLAVKSTFDGIDWKNFHLKPPPSPLAASAKSVHEDMLVTGVEASLLATFSDDYAGDNWAKAVEW